MREFLIKTREPSTHHGWFRKKAVAEHGLEYQDGKESFLSVTVPVMTIRLVHNFYENFLHMILY